MSKPDKQEQMALAGRLFRLASAVPAVQRTKLLKAAKTLVADSGAGWDVLARKIIDAIVDSRFSWEEAMEMLSKSAAVIEREDEDHEWYKWRSRWYARSIHSHGSDYEDQMASVRDLVSGQLQDARGRDAERATGRVPGMYLYELFETGVDVLGWDETEMDNFFELLGLNPAELKAGNRLALKLLKEMNDGRLFRTSAKWYFTKGHELE